LGRVQLIDASQWFKPLRKKLGKKNCQLSPKAFEILRFASGDEDLRATLFDEFGDDLCGHFSQVAAALERRLAEWGADDEEAQGDDGDEGAACRPGRRACRRPQHFLRPR